jgi:hypothetical protein
MNVTTFFRRLFLATGLALAALVPAALNGPATDAQTAPPVISPLRVLAFGTEATVSFTSSEPVAATITYQPSAGTGQPTVQASNTYTTAHETTLTGLTSNTQYQVSVAAETRAGQRTNGSANFYTAKQRVRVTLREIDITKDGDAWWSNGEPSWLVGLGWAGGETAGCFPNNGNVCETGSYGEGRFVPRNYLGQPLMWLFAEENFDAMPSVFNISADAEESDLDVINYIGRTFECIGRFFTIKYACGTFGSPNTSTEWRVPVGQEFASTPITVTANDSDEFLSTMAFTFELFYDQLSYPAARNTPQSTWAR